MGMCGSKPKANTNRLDIKIKPDHFEYTKEENKPLEAKIVLLGDQNVGKSSIAQRFAKNLFTGQYVVTIGGAYLQQTLILSNGVTIKFHIWDTGGQERFRSMANLYYRDAIAAILTYDCSNEKTFDSIRFWIDELKNKATQEQLVLCLAGNKCDIDSSERKISNSVGKQLAEEHKMIFYETSAKSDIGIKELFHSLGKKIYELKVPKEL